MIGLGFTLTEDVLYIMRGTSEGGAAAFTVIFFLRTILGGLGHATFTAMLAFRDRAIVIRNLVDEVGVMLHPKEFKLTTAGAQLVPLWNVMSLAGSPGGYWAARKKQLAHSGLAFLKHRRRRGESGSGLDSRERSLRGTIQGANERGVFIGKR